jgi:hypothetical protein
VTDPGPAGDGIGLGAGVAATGVDWDVATSVGDGVPIEVLLDGGLAGLHAATASQAAKARQPRPANRRPLTRANCAQPGLTASESFVGSQGPTGAAGVGPREPDGAAGV